MLYLMKRKHYLSHPARSFPSKGLNITHHEARLGTWLPAEKRRKPACMARQNALSDWLPTHVHMCGLVWLAPEEATFWPDVLKETEDSLQPAWIRIPQITNGRKGPPVLTQNSVRCSGRYTVYLLLLIPKGLGWRQALSRTDQAGSLQEFVISEPYMVHRFNACQMR